MSRDLPRICLIGPHGAGKTTLGLELADRLGVPFRTEIGRELREAALAQDANRHALQADVDFDRAVVEAELARDSALDGPGGFVVETWHPGNLAYARLRSPSVFEAHHAAARTAARVAGVVVVPVFAQVRTLMERCNEPGGTLEERTAFFCRVAREAERIARTWGLQMAPACDTSHSTVDTCVEGILAHLAHLGHRPGQIARAA